MQAVVIFALFSVNWLKQLNEFHKLQNVEHTLIVLANHCITTHISMPHSTTFICIIYDRVESHNLP